jgi:hypothetical protein
MIKFEYVVLLHTSWGWTDKHPVPIMGCMTKVNLKLHTTFITLIASNLYYKITVRIFISLSIHKINLVTIV